MQAMKDRSVWAFIVFALVVLGGIYLLRKKPAPAPSAPAPVVTRPAVPSEKEGVSATVALPASTPAPTTTPPPNPSTPMVRAGPNGEAVLMQDGKTIDMSSGRPVVRDDARSRAAIAKSAKEMEDAARNVTFAPRPAAPAEKKNAEPAPAAPKP